MKFNFKFVLIFILIFIGIETANAAGGLSFKRALYVNEWDGVLNTGASIDAIIAEAVYVKADAIIITIPSEYFESARNISRRSWDIRANSNYNGMPMLEYIIQQAHANGIQVHAWLGVNIVNSVNRAEYRLFGPSTNYPYNQVDAAGSKITQLSYRLDMTFVGLQDYEVGLLTWISKNYPSLDGIHIEEPLYYEYSYSTAVRNRIKIKFGYDPLYPPTNKTLDQIKIDITNVQRDGWNEFFTQLRKSINANKMNPNLHISTNSWEYIFDYDGPEGLDTPYLAKNHLVDSFVMQSTGADGNGGYSLVAWKSQINQLSNSITEIPVVAVAYVKSSGMTTVNPDFFEEVKNSCDYGADGVAIFAWHYLEKYTGGIIKGQNIMDTLNKISSSCGASTMVLTPYFSPPGGSYSNTQTISISTSTPSATIHYTTDGTNPTENSPTYSTPIVISSNTTLKAGAWKTGLTQSTIATETYSFFTSAYSGITNPGFESGTTSWTFYTNGIGTFNAASPGYEGNNAAVLALSSVGSNMQLYQTGITLEQNTRYRLSFAGYSTTGNDVSVRFIQHVSPFTSYMPEYVANLGKTWQTFTTEFEPTGFTGAVNDARLQFWLSPFAAAGDTYYIDDIRLEKVNSSNNIYDLNNNGSIDINDLSIISDHMDETTTPPYPNYDVNTNGKIDILDLILVSSKIK